MMVVSWAGRVVVPRVGWRIEMLAERMDVMSVGWMAVSWVEQMVG